jgi:hypothetical protein
MSVRFIAPQAAGALRSADAIEIAAANKGKTAVHVILGQRLCCCSCSCLLLFDDDDDDDRQLTLSNIEQIGQIRSHSFFFFDWLTAV